MMPPTSIDGTDITGATIDGQDVQEITVDGQTVFEAVSIPNSVIHHYNPANFTAGNWPDEVGTSDMGTISGLTFDASAFANNGGVAGDGNDHGLSDTMGNFGQDRDTDFAISVPFNTTDDDVMLLGHDELGESARSFELGMGISFHGASSGELGFRLRDSSGNTLSAATSGNTFNDGNDHHLILNKTSNSSGGLEFYVDDMTTNIGSNDTDGGFSNASVQNFDGPMGFFAVSQSGTPVSDNKMDGTMGNIRFFDDSLSQSERQDVDDALPWS
jgi:hypothetical protein